MISAAPAVLAALTLTTSATLSDPAEILPAPYFQQGAFSAPVVRFRAGDWAAAAAGLSSALSSESSSPERAAARYLLGLAQMNLGQWRPAAATFEDLHREYPLLAPYHAYQAARCHLRLGDDARALAWAARVPNGSVPDAEARLIRLEALARGKRWLEVDLEAANYLQAFRAGPRRAEAMLVRGRALEARGRLAEAAALFRQTWAEAPSASWTTRAAESLARVAALPAARGAAERTAGDWISRGMVLFEQNENEAAEAAFASAIAAPRLDDAGACRAHFHRAQSVWKQRQRARALPLYGAAVAACEKARDADLTVKALYQRARCLAATGDRAGASQAYALIEARHASHSYADDARLRAAEVARDGGDEAAAAALLRELPARYPTGDMVGEAVWRLAFRAYQSGEMGEARRWLLENLRLVPRATVWYAEGRAEYWLGRIAEGQGAWADARRHYEQAVRGYPLSVYALLALARMGEKDRPARDALVQALRSEVAAPARTAPAGFDYQATPGFQRAIELARLGLGADAHRELAKLSPRETSESSRDERMEWAMAAVLDRARLWSVSHAIPRHRLTQHKLVHPVGEAAAQWRLSHPRAYADVVDEHARAAGAPMALLMGIMREESAFDPRAVSTANCLGLIMLKPDTANRFAGRRVGREELFDPATNIAIGSRFLSALLKRYRGAVPLAIAAYNSGEGAVDRWLGERGQLALDEFLETIPYDETRNYTKRVLASYFAYSWLYAADAPVPPVSFALPTVARR